MEDQHRNTNINNKDHLVRPMAISRELGENQEIHWCQNNQNNIMGGKNMLIFRQMLRGSRGLSAGRARRNKSSRPKGP